METTDSFYVVLTSNASKNMYPDNKMINFKTKLPKSLHLNEDWKVGLADFTFTNSRKTFDDTQYVYVKIPNAATKVTNTLTIDIEPASFTSLSELAEIINAKLSQALQLDEVPELVVQEGVVTVRDGYYFDEHAYSKMGKFDVPGVDMRVSLSFSPTLHNILGVDRWGRAFLNARQSNLYVYSDIVRPRVVGDVSVPLLRVVDAANTSVFGSSINCVFKEPYYCKLAFTDIDEIEIQLLDDSGHEPYFFYGETILTLHFKHG